MSRIIDLVEYVERPKGVVGPKADHKQEEDEEGLLGATLVSVRVGKVWPFAGNSEKLRGDFSVAEHQHGEDEPEEDHH